MGVFKRLLGLNSLECPEAPIVRRQVALSISNGGIGLISLKVITRSTYIGSQALVTPIMASMILLDFFPFLLEAIGANSLKPLPF
jgi:hypothetical protein